MKHIPQFYTAIKKTKHNAFPVIYDRFYSYPNNARIVWCESNNHLVGKSYRQSDLWCKKKLNAQTLEEAIKEAALMSLQ